MSRYNSPATYRRALPTNAQHVSNNIPSTLTAEVLLDNVTHCSFVEEVGRVGRVYRPSDTANIL